MQHIGKVFVSVAFSLFMIGCLADDGTLAPVAYDGDGEPSNVERRGDVPSANAENTSDASEAELSGAGSGSLLSTTGPAPLGTGVTTTTTNCNDDAWISPASGTSHAGIRACQIIWGKDVSVSPTEYFQQVSFQLRDEATDGKCAQATATGGFIYTECNGVWVTKTANLNGHHSSITVTLSWGGNDPVSRTRSAPIGF